MKPGALLIRADASLAIGTGHVMRCLALAQAWQDAGGTASLAAAELPDALVPRLAAEGISLMPVRTTPAAPEDARETVAQARHLGAEWIVIDGDRFSSGFLETVRASGIRVLLIDDFANRESFPVDLIVNPNLDDDQEPYQKRSTTARLLMGPSYVLLRREFRQVVQKKDVRQIGNRILVTLGGSDPENLTPRIVNALATCSDFEVTVVAGAGFDKVDEIQKLNANNVRVIVNAPNMPQLMNDSDQAIIAAGGTLWELLSIGCPVLSYSRNIVQARVVQALSNPGTVLDLGETCLFDSVRLVGLVRGLLDSSRVRAHMSNLGRTLVDGMGASRVVEAAQQLGAN
jgi:UDP-2,4-diacetamido-2,4,6-trideoxy-beta-L-altropyranose hydrolase